jgi:hypothetical protein
MRWILVPGMIEWGKNGMDLNDGVTIVTLGEWVE